MDAVRRVAVLGKSFNSQSPNLSLFHRSPTRHNWQFPDPSLVIFSWEIERGGSRAGLGAKWRLQGWAGAQRRL